MHALTNLLFQRYFLLLAEKQQFPVIFVLKMGCFQSTASRGEGQLLNAVKRGDEPGVLAALSEGADVNVVDKNGSTALMWAANNGHEACVRILLENGADVNAVNKDGQTALMYAANEGHEACVRTLLENGADVNVVDSIGRTVLMYAANEGHEACVRILLENGADVNVVKNKNGETALIWAAGKGHDACVRILLENGADVNAVNKYGNTALILAASEGHEACVRILLHNGADVNAVNKNGNIALILAADKGHEACVRVLLDSGADVNVVNKEGATALILASGKGHDACVRILLQNGADVNAVDKDGDTALIKTVATEGHVACVRMLLENGADVNVANKYGNTALIKTVATEGNTDCVLALLEYGADVSIANTFGDTALTWATSEGDRNCIAILQHHKDNPRTSHKKGQPQISKTSTPSAPPQPLQTQVISQRVHSPSPLTSSVQAPPPPTVVAADQQQLHQNWMVPYSDLVMGTLLGSGSFATVYNATWHGTEVAVKVFKLPDDEHGSQTSMLSAALLPKIEAEANLLAAIRHPHVVAFLGMCAAPPSIITEKCSRGSLFDLLQRANQDPRLASTLTWSLRLRLAADTAAGMAHLHQRTPPVLHRDLKSANLLIDSSWRVKVSDLGLSKLLEEVTAASTVGSTSSNLNPRWLAAEVMETGTWTAASDVYSFGIVLWELMTWQFPWSHLSNAFMVSKVG